MYWSELKQTGCFNKGLHITLSFSDKFYLKCAAHWFFHLSEGKKNCKSLTSFFVACKRFLFAFCLRYLQDIPKSVSFNAKKTVLKAKKKERKMVEKSIEANFG